MALPLKPNTVWGPPHLLPRCAQLEKKKEKKNYVGSETTPYID